MNHGIKKLIACGFASALLSREAIAVPLSDDVIRRAKSIAIMVGSFDPVTYGHIDSAESVIKQAGDDLVILVPSPAPPHKDLIPQSQRLDLMDTALHDNPNLAYPSEGDYAKMVGKLNYQTKLLQRIRKLNPGVPIDAVMGTDVAEGLHGKITLNYQKLTLKPRRWIVVDRDADVVQLPGQIAGVPIKRVQPTLQGISSTKVRTFFSQHSDLYLEHGAVSADRLPPQIPTAEANRILELGIYLGASPENKLTLGSQAQHIYRSTIGQAINNSGLYDWLRAYAKAPSKESGVTEVTLKGQTFQVKKLLGAGMRAEAYLIDYNGQTVAVKVANEREGSEEALKVANLVQGRLLSRGGMSIPQLIDADPDGKWVVSEFVKGQNFESYLVEHGSVDSHLLARLKSMYEKAKVFANDTGLILDLRADNFIIRDGVPYLIDLGPHSKRSSVSRNFR